jgi:pimeloyl-ACP methyl ester carboxylesterase
MIGWRPRLVVFWHHGTPNTGVPPEPLFPAAAQHGVRWVSYDRPGYGGSTPHPGRDIASAAVDASSVADALGIGQFAVMGHSGGGSHAWHAARCCHSGWWAWSAWPNGPVGRPGA